jgi:hypothetical protein
VQSDLVGLAAGLNTFAYVSAAPLRLADALGLSDADVQGVWRDVNKSFGDIHPSSGPIGYESMGKAGHTSNYAGDITIDPSWAKIDCFTPFQYRDLFLTLFHEAMHSSDSAWTRFNPFNRPDDSPYHSSVYNRANYEDARMPNRPDLV